MLYIYMYKYTIYYIFFKFLEKISLAPFGIDKMVVELWKYLKYSTNR